MVKSFKLTAVLVAACIVAAGNFRLLFNSLLVEDKRGSFIATDYSVLKKVPKACGNATFLKEIQAMRKKQTKLFGTSRHPNQTHWPTFFKSRVKLGQLARRQHYLTPRSGCRLARWVVRSPTSENKAVIDCHMRHAQQVLNITAIQHNDTIYVPLNALKRFVSQSLPLLRKDIVLITGQWQSVEVPDWNQTFARLIGNPRVQHIFVMHKPLYAPISSPQITSWPLGLNFRQIPEFSNEFVKRATKRETIFYSKLGPTAEFRRDIPSGPRLPPERYYQRLHAARFILAPSGRRPDSFRMYEAIGLAAKPITNLDPSLFEHFQDELDSFVFGVERWDPNDLICYAMASGSSVANQRMVFDEYWMEYVERRVNVPLRWWDNKRMKPAYLEDVALKMSK
jgi:hypothetical protein